MRWRTNRVSFHPIGSSNSGQVALFSYGLSHCIRHIVKKVPVCIFEMVSQIIKLKNIKLAQGADSDTQISWWEDWKSGLSGIYHHPRVFPYARAAGWIYHTWFCIWKFVLIRRSVEKDPCNWMTRISKDLERCEKMTSNSIRFMKIYWAPEISYLPKGRTISQPHLSWLNLVVQKSLHLQN